MGEIARRAFIDGAALSAGGLIGAALAGLAPTQSTAASVSPSDDSDIAALLATDGTRSARAAGARSAIVANVRDFGAVGDGIFDCTTAFQAAADHVRDHGGGTLLVPDGTFLIDPTGSSGSIWLNEGGIRLWDHTIFRMSPDTILRAKPNGMGAYRLLRIVGGSDITIEGGTLQGDRAAHTSALGEHGHGISIMGSDDIRIRDVTCRDFWGDGINLQRLTDSDFANAPTDIVIERVRCVNNRRQGMSIEGGNGVVVRDSTFEGTNGTDPQAGIDIEPPTSRGLIRNIRLHNITCRGNAGRGLQISTWEETDTIIVDGAWLESNGAATKRPQLAVMSAGSNITLRSVTTRNTLKGQPAISERGIKSGFRVENADLDAPLSIAGAFGGEWSQDYTVSGGRIIGGIAISRARHVRLSHVDIICDASDIGIDLTYPGSIHTQFVTVDGVSVRGGAIGIVTGNATMSTTSLTVSNTRFFDQSGAAIMLKGVGAVITSCLFLGYAQENGTAAIESIGNSVAEAPLIHLCYFDRTPFSGSGRNEPKFAIDLGRAAPHARVSQNRVVTGALAPDHPYSGGAIIQHASAPMGSTANRPTPSTDGQIYIDTGLDKILFARDGKWRDAMGKVV